MDDDPLELFDVSQEPVLILHAVVSGSSLVMTCPASPLGSSPPLQNRLFMRKLFFYSAVIGGLKSIEARASGFFKRVVAQLAYLPQFHPDELPINPLSSA